MGDKRFSAAVRKKDHRFGQAWVDDEREAEWKWQELVVNEGAIANLDLGMTGEEVREELLKLLWG